MPGMAFYLDALSELSKVLMQLIAGAIATSRIISASPRFGAD
jgi:hypothetical protein